MKVLFAVNDDQITKAIVKKYQQQNKEIIAYKSVYYFNAILKELQKDPTYDRIVISEDLEPFANNNYTIIDKFIFEKLDAISDEAANSTGDTPIILLCYDRRNKGDDILVKLFGIGIYDALLGQDRSVDQICNLLKRSRNKKEAKMYYNIDSDDVSYQHEDEDSVSESEIQNILAHYRRLGKNEDRYVDSFNNIAAQYTDGQLRTITKFLPVNVKNVLEVNSPKYQSIMSFKSLNTDGMATSNNNNENKTEQDKFKIGFIEDEKNKPKLTKPVIIPSAVNRNNSKKVVTGTSNSATMNNNRVQQEKTYNDLDNQNEEDIDSYDNKENDFDENQESYYEEGNRMNNRNNESGRNGGMKQRQNVQQVSKRRPRPETEYDDIDEEEYNPQPRQARIREEENMDIEPDVNIHKKGRGRPRKERTLEEIAKENMPKKGRGRPKKVVQNYQENDDLDEDEYKEESVQKTKNNYSNNKKNAPVFEEDDDDIYDDEYADEDEYDDIPVRSKAKNNTSKNTVAHDDYEDDDLDDYDLDDYDYDDVEEEEPAKVEFKKQQPVQSKPALKKQVVQEDEDDEDYDFDDEDDDLDDYDFDDVEEEEPAKVEPKKQQPVQSKPASMKQAVQEDEDDEDYDFDDDDDLDDYDFDDVEEEEPVKVEPKKQQPVQSKPAPKKQVVQEDEEDEDYDFDDEDDDLDDYDFDDVEEEEPVKAEPKKQQPVQSKPAPKKQAIQEDEDDDLDNYFDDDDDYDYDDAEEEEPVKAEPKKKQPVQSKPAPKKQVVQEVEDDDDFEDYDDDDDYDYYDDAEDEEPVKVELKKQQPVQSKPAPKKQVVQEVENDDDFEDYDDDDDFEDYDDDDDYDYYDDAEEEEPVKVEPKKQQSVQSKPVQKKQVVQEVDDNDEDFDEFDDYDDDDFYDDAEEEEAVKVKPKKQTMQSKSVSKKQSKQPIIKEKVQPKMPQVEEEDDDFDEFDDYDDDDIINASKSNKKVEKNIPSVKNNKLVIPKSEPVVNQKNQNKRNYQTNEILKSNMIEKEVIQDIDISKMITGNKKIAAFIGTSKNGTSFIVSNMAEMLSNKGINVAILDLTKNRNSYYVYTKNDERLRQKAANAISNLRVGTADGIKVNKNLTVYTTLPDEYVQLEESGKILSTLLRSHSLILLDCDFSTPEQYFKQAQEIFLIQTMDVLTIQPLTAFLRNLKIKEVLDPEKIRIIINKEQRVRGLSTRAIIGGMAYYNDPSMSFMTELFDKEKVQHCVVPFDMQTYSKYLEGLVNCDISLKGYSRGIMESFRVISDMIYPPMMALNNKQQNVRRSAPVMTSGPDYSRNNTKFSKSMNDTLEQMKKKY